MFDFGSKKFLGIDVGSSCLKIIELRKKGRNFQLENYGEAETTFFKKKSFKIFKKETFLLSSRNVAQAIQSVCREAEIKTREVNFAIPDFHSFFTSFEMPVMSKEELAQAIRYEVRPYVPLPFSEITLDWVVTEGEVGKTPLKILAVVIPNDIISQYQEIAAIAKLKIKFLEPEVFALARSLAGKEKKDGKEKKLIGLVDIGAYSTSCSVLEGGVLKTSHSFNLAGNELTERLAKSLDIDYNEAEELKRKRGLVLNKDKEGSQKDVRKSLLPIVGSISEEIKKIFRDFFQKEGKEIEEIILAGGLSLLPGLKEYLSVELKKKITIADPFSGISYPSVLSQILKKRGPSYAVAVGLALKGLE